MFIPSFVIIDDCCPPHVDHSCFVLVFVPEAFSRRSRAASPVTGKVLWLTLLRWWSTGSGQAGCFLFLVFWRICSSNMRRLRVDFGLVSKLFKIMGTPKLCKWPTRLNNSTSLLSPIHLRTLILPCAERKLEEHVRRMENKLERLSSATSQCSEGWTRALWAPGGQRVDVEEM